MWLWIIATLVAFFIKGLCGFANTLVFTSILGFGASDVNISHCTNCEKYYVYSIIGVNVFL